MPEIEYKVDDTELQGMLKGILSRMGNLKPAMALIGETLHTSIMENFEEGGRPKKWKKLADRTMAERVRDGTMPGGRILVRQGHANGLQGSIAYTALNDRVIVHANKTYARVLHYGGKAGRNRKANIPARPFMMIQDEDWDEMKDQLKNFIFQGDRNA